MGRIVRRDEVVRSLYINPLFERTIGPILFKYEFRKLKFSCGVICYERAVNERMSENKTVIFF